MRISRALELITVSLIALGCLIPLLSRVVPLPQTLLYGVETKISLPALSLEGFQNGAVQQGVEQWALKAHPLWGWAVKISNELIYRVWGEVSLDYRTSVQGGSEGYLWQPMYLSSFNRVRPPPAQIINNAYSQLALLQRFFASKGIPLITVVSPNLLALYPELLPEKYRAIEPHASSYEVAREAIARYKPEVIDSFELLRTQQSRFPFRFFEPTGSHWNEVGSCLAVREVARRLATAWREQIPDPRCEQFRMEQRPRVAETDLVEIANLLHPERLYRTAPYLTEHPSPTLRTPRKVLLVGTSFLFGLEKQLLDHGIAHQTALLFYMKQIRHNGTGAFKGFKSIQLSADELLSYDAIILDANVASPGNLGYGFLWLAANRFSLPGGEPRAAPAKSETPEGESSGSAE